MDSIRLSLVKCSNGVFLLEHSGRIASESNGSNGIEWTPHSTKPSQMVSCCISTQALKQVSRMDQIDQMESSGLHSIKPGQMVKWRLVA